jgi:hypothetical protein
LTQKKSVVLFRSTIESIPFSTTFHATFAIRLSIPFFTPNAFAFFPVKNANAIFAIFHCKPSVEDDISEAAALILALGGGKIGTVIRASANINESSHFRTAMGKRE